MDFEPNADQLALVDATRAFCEGRFPSKTVRGLIAEGGVNRALWGELAGTGIFGLAAPAAAGGAGGSMADAVLVFEELGRALVPGPLVGTHLAAGLIDGALEGESVVGILEGAREPVLVEHPAALDHLLVLTERPGEDRRVDAVPAASLDSRPLARPWDPLTPVAELSSLPRGRPVAIGAAADDFLCRARTLTAALSLGIARRSVEVAVDYARGREQFDRPIGSFQAVKHLLADAATRAEVARAALHAAGVTIDDAMQGAVSTGDASRAVAGAKLLASRAAVSNARTCIQVHGGMGFTWEMDPHLFLKRAMVLAGQLGTPEECAEELADVR